MPLTVGVIGKIEGEQWVKDQPSVCNYLQYYQVGDEIDRKKIGTLAQQFCRITFLADTEEEVRDRIEAFKANLKVYSVDGSQMNGNGFDTKRL